jgi:TRAP-type C4-dicarboxylate transport system substrate-binding protein
MKNILLALITLSFSFSAWAQKPITITMGNVFGDTPEGVMPTHTPRIQALFAKKNEEYTDGQIKWVILKGKQQDGISIFRSPSLTAEGKQLQATNVPAFFLPRVPEMGIQAIPFLFEGVEHSRRFMTSEPAKWLSGKIEEAYGVKVLGHFFNAAYISVNGVEPVREPNDFSGKIINGFDKSWDPMWTNIIPKERRFIGTQEAWTGALVKPNSDFDINIGMIQNNHRQRLHERFKHTTLVENFYNIFYTMMINRELWDGLTDFQRAGIERAVHEAQSATISYQIDTTLWALQLSQSEGTKMHFLTSDERKRWKQKFYPKMVEAVVAESNTPDETRMMIKNIETLVDDLRWQ